MVENISVRMDDKGANPFNPLAKEAIREYEAGDTITLDEFAKREGISMDK